MAKAKKKTDKSKAKRGDGLDFNFGANVGRKHRKSTGPRTWRPCASAWTSCWANATGPTSCQRT
jgi:hypothetical protein